MGRKSKPIRLQRKRTKGYRLQSPNGLPIVCVDRSTPWGNPFITGKHGTAARCVELFRLLLGGHLCMSFDWECVERQCRFIRHAASHIRELRGRDLCCWCGLSSPCHADTLLEIANRGKR